MKIKPGDPVRFHSQHPEIKSGHTYYVQSVTATSLTLYESWWEYFAHVHLPIILAYVGFFGISWVTFGYHILTNFQK